MKITSIVSLCIGFVCLLISVFFIIVNRNIGSISADILTINQGVYWAVIGWVLSFGAFIFSIFYESSSSHNETRLRLEKYEKCINTILLRLGMDSDLSIILQNHYEHLRQLGNVKQKSTKFPKLLHQYVRLWFDNIIDNEVVTIENSLRKGLLIIEDDKIELHQNFIEMCWKMSEKDGKIKITSIVKPPPEGRFWMNPYNYLKTQKDFLDESKCSITRYFICVENYSEWLSKHQEVLKSHFELGLEAVVVIYKDLKCANNCYQDLVLVDSFLANINEINNGEIVNATCYIETDENRRKIKEIDGIFINIEHNENNIKLKEYSKFEDFMTAVQKKIDSIESS
jgi:hypothetical protein